MNFFVKQTIPAKEPNKDKLELSKTLLFRLMDEGQMYSRHDVFGYCLDYYINSAFPTIVSYLSQKEIDAYHNFISIHNEIHTLLKSLTTKTTSIDNEQYFSNRYKKELKLRVINITQKEVGSLVDEKYRNMKVFLDPMISFLKELVPYLEEFYQQPSKKNLLNTTLRKLISLRSDVYSKTKILIFAYSIQGTKTLEDYFEKYFFQNRSNLTKAKQREYPNEITNHTKHLAKLREEYHIGIDQDWSFDKKIEPLATEKGLTIEEYKIYYTLEKIDDEDEMQTKANYYRNIVNEQNPIHYDNYIDKRTVEILKN
ncbi:Uncharacterised protein [Streptococcus pyogenes]|uniref:hypothetical protein n=1 Tax=Streptococcus pyogenes TaxID=1314 RepID=UPI0010A0F7C9|nr:hypothetical protein [Streptococcus pyogenes]VHK62870.1 Uncharacterised protein [Streptococcus pyogenes]HER9148748.1 hypothetical protein [Streptococcus pyogenes]